MSANSEPKGWQVRFQSDVAAANPIITVAVQSCLLHGLGVIYTNTHARTDDVNHIRIEQVELNTAANNVQAVAIGTIDNYTLNRGFPLPRTCCRPCPYLCSW